MQPPKPPDGIYCPQEGLHSRPAQQGAEEALQISFSVRQAWLAALAATGATSDEINGKAITLPAPTLL